MHNLHLGVVVERTGEDACSSVEYHINDWGNENNWRTICGAVSADNDVYSAGDGRWQPDEDCNTIEKINEMVSRWLQPDQYSKEKLMNCIWGKNESPFDWYAAAQYCKQQFEVERLGGKEFDVLHDEFYSWKLDENGVTNFGYSEQNEGKIWVVFIDMHS